MARSTSEVFEDHLRLRMEGDLEADLRRNYWEDVTLLTVNSNGEGHDMLRMSAERLAEQLPNGRYEFLKKQVRGPYALLIWRARSDGVRAVDGADSFLIEDGKIRMQTIHYRLID
jgi:hypothetical protein